MSVEMLLIYEARQTSYSTVGENIWNTVVKCQLLLTLDFSHVSLLCPPLLRVDLRKTHRALRVIYTVPWQVSELNMHPIYIFTVQYSLHPFRLKSCLGYSLHLSCSLCLLLSLPHCRASTLHCQLLERNVTIITSTTNKSYYVII